MDWQRYLNAFREKGPKQLIKNRVSWYLNPLLRKHWYPTIHPRFVSRLELENARRRSEDQKLNKVHKPGRVFVVVCVDTEGPCALGASHTWDAVQAEFKRLAAPSFRNQHLDSEGASMVVNWFVVDWVGGEACPRALAPGYHAVYDRYLAWLEAEDSEDFRDEIHWHYHHGFEGRLGSWNRDWHHLPLYEQVLCRKIIERKTFPSVYRAGNTWEDNDVSNWLNRFIPFDLSNQGPYKNVHYDWSRAPTKWCLYHPSADDFQSAGQQERLMGRSIGMESDQFVEADIEQAFLDASEGRDTYVSFWLHDYQVMSDYITKGLERIQSVASRFPEVSWQHSSALNLFRVLEDRHPVQDLTVTGTIEEDIVRLEFSHDVFGEPWLAAKQGDQFIRIDMQPLGSKTKWKASIGPSVDRLGVAATDQHGQVTVLSLR